MKTDFELESIEYGNKFYNVLFDFQGNITEILEFELDQFKDGQVVFAPPESPLRSYLQDVVDSYLNAEYPEDYNEGFYD